MASREDVDMADMTALVAHDYTDLLQTNSSAAFAFSDIEKRALHLYHQLQELELEHSLLLAQSAQESASLDFSDDNLQQQLALAEREAMEAKAEYEIRNSLTQSVLAMDPTLKAVHGGERTAYAEKRVLPLIGERDTVSMVHNSLTSRLATLQRAISTAERENIIANRRNRELSVTMLALAKEMKAQSARDIEDPHLRDQAGLVEKELTESKRRMKTLRGIISAMIVGSGINWAADANLTELVMDDE